MTRGHEGANVHSSCVYMATIDILTVIKLLQVLSDFFFLRAGYSTLLNRMDNYRDCSEDGGDRAMLYPFVPFKGCQRALLKNNCAWSAKTSLQSGCLHFKKERHYLTAFLWKPHLFADKYFQPVNSVIRPLCWLQSVAFS